MSVSNLQFLLVREVLSSWRLNVYGKVGIIDSDLVCAENIEEIEKQIYIKVF
jgi:hypothetical protein